METRTIILIISAVISLGALVVSIISLCVNNKREKIRKLKDVIIEEYACIQREILRYLTPIVNGEAKYTCQETISWFKFTVQKIEAICLYTSEQVTLNLSDLKIISNDIQSLRTYLTEAPSFGKSYNDGAYKLQNDEIIEIERLYTDVYKAFLSVIAMVNGSDRRKK